jgi:hypothetical protein
VARDIPSPLTVTMDVLDNLLSLTARLRPLSKSATSPVSPRPDLTTTDVF